jgi:hypothetical protein
MSTQSDSSDKHKPSKHLENFSEPRTYPSQWNVSELSGNRHSSSQEPEQKAGQVAAETPPAEPEYPEISFSEWHLGAVLDRYDALDTSYFSAL